MRRLRRAILALLMLLPLSVAYPQDSGISLDIIGISSTDLSRVAIHASILDSSGRLVSGLGARNFSVGGDLAGMAEVTGVENVTDDDLDFASVLVIDTSSSMADRPLSLAQAAARSYLEALGDDDPVALVSFNNDARLLVDYSTDRQRLNRAIDTLAYGGKTALYDATLLGIETAIKAPLPRKAVIILSDGGEYGNVSEQSRDASIRAATINGVPVYSIGLGWHIDRRFLEAISQESNAAFYDTPTPEELGDIFRMLAFLFRSQYIVSLSVDVEADGARYDFTLDVTTDDGRRASGSARLRAPIPIPLLFLPDDVFSEALRDDTQITVEIRADQDIESIEYAVDGEVVSTEESYTIEPEAQQPGEYQLDITVEDVEGDVGRLSADFEIAALPPRLTDDFEAADEEEIVEAELISVEAGGQTEITQVEFIVDGEVLMVDSEAPYEFDLDPFMLPPTAHILEIRATNAGGQTTTVEKDFEVERIPPRLEIEGLAEGAVISEEISASITALGQSPIVSLSLEPDIGAVVIGDRLDFVLDAVDLPPGPNAIAVRAVDEAGAETVRTLEFEVAPLPPTVALSGVAVEAVISGPQSVSVDAGGQTEIARIEVAYNGGPAEPVEDERFTIPADALGDGEHEALVTVTNEGGETATVALPFTVQLPPTPTFTPLPTNTATPTETPSLTPSPTQTSTQRPTLTPDPAMTATAQAAQAQTATAAAPSPTETAPPTDAPTDTPVPTALPTSTPIPTSTPLPTDTATSTPQPTNTATSTPLPTNTATSTPLPTNTATSTPLPTDTATNTPQPTDTSTSTPLPTDTATSTPLPTDTATSTPQPTDTSTSTPLPTDTATSTPLPTDTPTDTPVPTDTPTDTPVPTDTPTDTPVPTDTPTDTPVPTDTPTDTPVPTDTPTDTPVPTDTPTDTPVPTDTPTDTPVPTDTPTDTPVPTDTPTDTPVPTDTPTDTPVPTDTPTDTPVPTDTPTDTSVPTDTPTDTPVPTDTPTDTPVPTDTPTDTPVPTDTPTDTPVPTDTPTDTPVPTDTPTDTPVPTDTPTDTPVPTDTPTDTPVPTDTPTDTPVPTDTPTDTPVPTDTPTDTPVPTDTPTDTPVPTDTPTDTPVPTDTPTDTPVPTDTPTDTPVPTDTPTDTPVPTDTPTDTPVPTDTPTDTPVPTDTPTDTPVPTDTPSPAPTADAGATAEAQASLTAETEGTESAATEQAEATAEATQRPTEQPTQQAPAATDAPTQTAVDEPTAQPTLTPVTITEVDDPSADEPETRDTALAIGAVVIGLLLLLILFLLSRRR